MANPTDITEIEKLSVRERLALIDRIWDTLPDSVVPEDIPDWHIELLGERLKTFDESSPRETVAGSSTAYLGGPMTRPITIRPEADSDIRNAAVEYEFVRAGLGQKYLDELQRVLDRIEFMPESFGVVWRKVRAVRIGRFRHVVYYIVFDTRVDIIAVVHGSRHSPAWKSRV